MIEHYSFGNMTVNGQSYKDDVKIISGRPRSGWWRRQGHLVQTADIIDIMDASPDIVVIGTGSSGMLRIDRSVEQRFQQKNIQILAEPTATAVETFNRLAGEGKNVAGAFHLTC